MEPFNLNIVSSFCRQPLCDPHNLDSSLLLSCCSCPVFLHRTIRILTTAYGIKVGWLSLMSLPLLGAVHATPPYTDRDIVFTKPLVHRCSKPAEVKHLHRRF